MRGATFEMVRGMYLVDISIHAPREGCDPEDIQSDNLTIRISIHAPREGCDSGGKVDKTASAPISIHAPREGCDMT